MVWDLLNWHTLITELIIGGAIAIGLFVLQIRLSRKVNDFILQKAELEQKYKTSQCQIIIEHLKDIEDREKSVKDTLTNYQIGNQTNELSNKFMEIMVRPFKYRIEKMSNAMGKLEGRLNDPSLGEQFSEYLGFFDFLPTRILIDKIPQQAKQKHQIDGLISGIDKQKKRIQEFIDKFTQEMGSSLAEKHEEDQSLAHEVIDRSKYFIAPKKL